MPALPSTMKAAVLHGREDVRIERVDVPPSGAGTSFSVPRSP